jgi:hypothetical protein
MIYITLFMEKKESDRMAWLLNYEPSLLQRVEILQEIKETGKSIEEVCAMRSMPDLLIVEKGKVEYEGELLTPEEIRDKNPGKKFVFIF